MSKVFTITEGLENMGALKTGGQGSVYKARRIGPIITAVKLLPTPIHSESEADKNYRDFRNEVTKLQRVSEQPNPNIVRILSWGITESGSLPYIEMEFIEGPDLEELLQPPHAPVFTLKEAIKVAEHLSNALAQCHRLGISHGDIKSNNVKFNTHTGNYVLLDFGLAIMSDEQRRTSLRQAGAIEFMAPEQHEGQLVPQSDVYAFGVILYELLAGKVPFPLSSRHENARNEVRLQHMEAPVPDLLQLRQQNLPAGWSEDKKAREMQVPQWLLDMVAQSLQKDPTQRFATGAALNDFLVLHSTHSKPVLTANPQQGNALQQENEQLRKEKSDLHKALQQQTQLVGAKEQELVNLRVALTRLEREAQHRQAYNQAATTPLPTKRRNSMRLPMVLAGLFIGGTVLYLALSNLFRDKEPEQEKTPVQKEQKTEPEPVQRRVIGEYKVVAARAYFHNEPEEASRRGAYLIPSQEVIKALEENGDFLYTEFTNSRGQTSKGWLLKTDLMPLAEWQQQQDNLPATAGEISEQLQQAKRHLEQGETPAALALYKKLAAQEVPEALFEYGNRALKGEHEDLDCDVAFQMVNKASERDYVPARRTLGFLYLFGQNKQVLRMSKYERCSFERNIVKGTRLLMEAISAGDSTANDILNDFNKQEGNTPDDAQ